jgi:hypothetical protein
MVCLTFYLGERENLSQKEEKEMLSLPLFLFRQEGGFLYILLFTSLAGLFIFIFTSVNCYFSPKILTVAELIDPLRELKPA